MNDNNCIVRHINHKHSNNIFNRYWRLQLIPIFLFRKPQRIMGKYCNRAKCWNRLESFFIRFERLFWLSMNKRFMDYANVSICNVSVVRCPNDPTQAISWNSSKIGQAVPAVWPFWVVHFRWKWQFIHYISFGVWFESFKIAGLGRDEQLCWTVSIRF